MAHRIKTLWIKPEYLAQILAGRKTVEVRVGYENIRRLRPGDQLRLNDEYLYTIVRVGHYASFEEMLAHEDAAAIAPDVSAEELLALCREIYPPEKEALGVVTLEIQPAMRIYDISLPISSKLPAWPGDPAVQVARVSCLEAGEAANVSRLSLSAHAGTHVDAPFHVLKDGHTVDQLPLDLLVGEAWVAAVPDVPFGQMITADRLAALQLPPGVRRLLLKTVNSDLWADGVKAFRKDFVALAPDAADWLVECGVRLIGVDYLSVEGFGAEEMPVHRTLLRAGVVIVEGLNLSAVEPGSYRLICLPLKLVGADGAPARAILLKE